MANQQQVRSKKRVMDHGEVLTNEREVNAMLDLVHDETLRFDSRFLEPACGDGNFLVAVLDRRLAKVDKEFRKHQYEWEINAAVSISCLYGVDILEDNVVACRERLFEHFDKLYRKRFKAQCREQIRDAIRFIIERNIIWGDALTMKTPESNSQKSEPIVFSEWSNVGGSNFKRRDFEFASILAHSVETQLPMFKRLSPDQMTLKPQDDSFPVTPLAWLHDPEGARNRHAEQQMALPGLEQTDVAP